MKNTSLSIFFPCYNDAGTIGSLVISAYEVAKSLTYDFEVIVIDDGSEDNSKDVLDSLLQIYNDLKIVYHETNQGYGSVLKSGFKNSSKDFIFYTDGDGQYDEYEFFNLYNINEARSGQIRWGDAIYTSKKLREGMVSEYGAGAGSGW